MSNDIKQLKFPDNVRTRYGMYIGSVDNPQIIVREIIDNSIDEIHANRALNIWIFNRITDNNEQEYIVADDGAGIPIKEAFDETKDGERVKKTMLGITQARLAMSTLNAGSKFYKTEIGTGQNGVGASCTNALSNSFDVYSKLVKHDISLAPKSIQKIINDYGIISDNDYYHMHYEKGLLRAENIVSILDTNLPNSIKKSKPSTITSFIPDNTIFKSTKCRIPLTTRYVKYIHPEAHFWINDVEDTSIPKTYEYNVRVKCINPNNLDDVLNPFIEFIISFGPSEKFDETEWDSSVNGLDTQSGVHINAIKEAYSKAFEEFFGSCSNRAYLGMNFMNIVLCNEPVFSSQTKERLADIPDFYVYDLPQLVNAFRQVIRKNRDAFYDNWLRIIEYLKSIQNADRISSIKSKVLITAESGNKAQCFVPHKLKDCSCFDRERACLMVVEGNSAAGTIIQARAGMDNIAVLPLRGKPLNSIYQDVNDILENEEMYDLINAIGVGVNEAYNLEEIRYGKVIICADADPDGSQINALVLGTLLYHLTFLVEKGYVYIAISPLYYQDGKYYYQGEEDKIDFSRKVTRFKGLGELNPKQFKETVLDENNQRLKQVTLGDLETSYALLSSTGARYRLMRDNGYADVESKFTPESVSFPRRVE